ncbi:Leo1-like protein [Coccomyxa subellipsoidea C-169]|uniref:Leo1-like protein n=1 Tax=Coccomyxa subellipsoidea (strain C-169) TaxID=574566 RepID=I0YXF7_COCSC|nr:Leo1-like protein [Coccomyxa subellipsoidea C-169]EIE23076.1 Leo1-like protein [Coccomyxa subellipsoidea C-169]|eukprot:XP_005647620.1 Leo1-like protein [Coccomyxa subellipsoidea C-169]
MADLDELFGSESDDDDFQPTPAATAAASEDAAEEDLPEEPAEEEADEPEEAVEEDEESGPAPSEDDVVYREPPPERPSGPPLALDAPPIARLESDNTALVKLSNIINIDMKPFDPATYKEAEEEEEYVDDQGTRRVRVRDQNVIRWRRTVKEDGSSGIESNARFVRWSDGSLQLMIGDEVLDVAELDIEKDNNFLFLRHMQAAYLESMGQIQKKLAFRPASLNSRFHQRLREAVERRHTKVNRVRSVATVEDPAREKAERERREEARIRATEQLERRQNKEMRRYTAGSRYDSRPRGEAGITAQYLEAMDDDDLGGDSDDAGGLTATERARTALRRNADEDAEAERRLSQAKRPQASAPAPPPKRQHFGPIESDDDEDDAEEDAPPRKIARNRQRGLVLSDDDD